MRRLLLPAMAFIVGSCAWAQTNGHVAGTVSDHSGAVVPGAKVVVAKVVATAVADESGSFQLPNLAPGEHLMLVEFEGFMPWSKSGIVVEEGKTSAVTAELSLGPMKETVISQNELAPSAIEWYSKVLRVMREPGLCELPSAAGSETYRFLWLRHDHEPVLVRVDKRADGIAHLTLKMTSGTAGWGLGKLKTTKTRKLSKQDSEYLKMIINEADFWQLPSQIDTGMIVMHGTSWTLEGTKNGECHVVDRDTPESDPVKRLGLRFLIDLARMKLLYQEVY